MIRGFFQGIRAGEEIDRHDGKINIQSKVMVGEIILWLHMA